MSIGMVARLAAAAGFSLCAASVQAAFFQIEPNGRTLHIVGSLTPFDAPVFGDVVRRNPSIEEISLTSEGGSMMAAMAIGRYIYDHGLRTRVKGYCLSACAFAWLAGRRGGLFVEDGAPVGIHVPFSDTQDNITLESISAGAWYLGSIGAPQPMIMEIMQASWPDNGMADFLPILERESIGITHVPMEALGEATELIPVSALGASVQQ
jgi:hypothetical protein